MSDSSGGQEPGEHDPPSEPPYVPPGQRGGVPPQSWPTPPQGGQPPQQGGYPPPQGGYPPPQSGYPPQQGGYGVPGRTSQASTALALSISGLVVTIVLGLCCGPFGIAGLILCGIGAYLGSQEVRAIEAGTGDPAHHGQARAALIVGVVGCAIFALGMIILVGFIVLGSLA